MLDGHKTKTLIKILQIKGFICYTGSSLMENKKSFLDVFWVMFTVAILIFVEFKEQSQHLEFVDSEKNPLLLPVCLTVKSLTIM